jgi:hypothetical protein
VSFWVVPPMWAGRTVAILASGPSMSAEVAATVRAAGVPTIVINNTFRLAPWADMLYAADAEWWAHPTNKDAHGFAGLKVSVSAVPGVQRLRNTGTEGYDADPAAVRTGSHSGYQATHIALHAGAKRVLLCGFDMHGSHWHGRHVDGLRETQQVHYAKFIARFQTLVEPASRLGVDIVNCTPGSALCAFRFAPLEDALCAEP